VLATGLTYRPESERARVRSNQSSDVYIKKKIKDSVFFFLTKQETNTAKLEDSARRERARNGGINKKRVNVVFKL